MKKHTKTTSLFICVMMLCMILAPMAVAADETQQTYLVGSVDIVIPIDELSSEGAIIISSDNVAQYISRDRNQTNAPKLARAGVYNDYRQKNHGGPINAMFADGQDYTESGIYQFPNADNSIPQTAEVTSVVVTSAKTNVTGVTYYVDMGVVNMLGFIEWADAKVWQSSVSFSEFNGLDPYNNWIFAFIATRIMPSGTQFATMSNVTVRVNYRYTI